MVQFRRWIRGRRDHRRRSNTASSTDINKSFNVRFFSYETLRLATNNFSTFLGHGAYGSVFKGVLPDDGRTVAIKTLHNPDQARFLERVDFLSHLRHVNLIQVIGCCLDQDVMLLVFKFAENGSISQLLHGERRSASASASASAFDWKRRAAVCIGIARGLSYLHEEIDPQVIHCDVKPANILLDANFIPKITDFDLMQFPDVEEDQDSSNYSTVKGTPGYMDPNYMSTGQLSDKVDVYSFGVTMVEIITGRRVVDTSLKDPDDQMIMDWVTRVRKEGTVLKIVDPKLTDFPKEDVERFINVALLCTQATPEQRPSMFEVVHMLYGRHKSDQEIAAMATVAIAAQPVRWFSRNSTLTSVSMSSSLTISTSGKANIADDSSSQSRGECSSKAARSGDSSGKEEEQSGEDDMVRAYFERSMEKIMRFQAAVHNESNRGTTMTTTKTMAIKRSSQRISMEAVYPPFLSGEYPRRSIQF